MSSAAEPAAAVALPPAWDHLDRAVDGALAALEAWRARALEAEAEVTALREALEEATAGLPAPTPGEARDQLRRLRAENAALRSRMAQAHRRLGTLMAWTDAFREDG